MSEAVATGVTVRRDGGVATVAIDRPAKRNALTFAMYRALNAAITEADADPDVRVIVLTGSGGAFTAGNDLADFLSGKDVVGGEESAVLGFQRAVLERGTILIAAVDGSAVGIGATVLLHCDLVYATERSYLQFPFVDIGLVPEFGSSLLLPRRVGAVRAAEILLLGDRLPAARAAELGLVNQIFADHETLLAHVTEQASRLLAKPSAAVAATWALLHGNPDQTTRQRMVDESARFSDLLSSPAAVQRLEGFLNGRK
ncbi:MAG TPA: enoyl-CoA hydratase-related protein [Pseudonocardiaceae bacterium]|jgi:enoyl-CoA hydratase/carnithine racemase|nr:enoyl-CoA hydratase-related protein [Pseudonocardiaceae bacterium]